MNLKTLLQGILESEARVEIDQAHPWISVLDSAAKILPLNNVPVAASARRAGRLCLATLRLNFATEFNGLIMVSAERMSKSKRFSEKHRFCRDSR